MSEKSNALQRLRDDYLKALIDGNRVQAAAVVEEALKVSGSPFSVYLEILSPAQVDVGELWLSGGLNVAQEHWATEVTLSIMEELKHSVEPRSSLGLNAVITSIEGDRHTLGARMVAHFFHFDGWGVDFLGADTPIHDLVEFVRRKRPDLVALSITLIDGFQQLREAVKQIRQLPFETHILVGGPATRTPNFDSLRPDLHIDGTAQNALDAIQQARTLLGVNSKAQSLDSVLQHVGSRIQQTRKSKRWSQKELGDAAGLDRTYISAVEHGKQNLTLGALKRLADALDVSIEELLSNNGLGNL